MATKVMITKHGNANFIFTHHFRETWRVLTSLNNASDGHNEMKIPLQNNNTLECIDYARKYSPNFNENFIYDLHKIIKLTHTLTIRVFNLKWTAVTLAPLGHTCTQCPTGWHVLLQRWSCCFQSLPHRHFPRYYPRACLPSWTERKKGKGNISIKDYNTTS